jgi:minor extracellular serine protease Vpr
MEVSWKRAVRAVSLLACTLAVLVVPSAFAGASTSAAIADGKLWFVELTGKPVADGGSSASLKAEKAAFKAAAANEKLSYKDRLSFETLWNGVSIEASPETAASLGKLDGVKNVWPVLTVSIPETTAADPELSTAIAQTGADIAQNELGLTGAGVKVAVMDTGVDYDNSSLGGDGVARTNSTMFPNSRVVAGRDLVGDAFNANSADPAFNPNPTPDALPDDCQGHGTHVAGIVGANGAIKGIAPGVQLGSYRVFGCNGSTTADIMLQAMEAALADDMDILNMSIGSAFQTWPQYPTAAGSDRLVNRGVIVVASIGNSGADGVYSAGAPGVGRKVIGVASMDNSHVELRTFTVTPDGVQIGYTNATGAPAAPTAGSATMSKTGTPASTADGCDSTGGVPASAAGTVVLIRRGTCTFHEKARNAQTAGAIGVVLYNNVAGRVSPTVVGPVAITIPVVAVSDTEGVLLNDRIAAGTTTLTWTNQVGKFQNATAGLASSFTSYGLTAELDLKPDVAAPGGLIRSTYPLEKGGSALLSGTSMASPHTAGAAALILQAHPDSKWDDIRARLQNTADPARWWGQPGNAALREPAHRQGAGMIDIDDAVLSTTRIDPSKLALGESQAGPQTHTLTIGNSSASAQSYALGNTSGIGTGNTFSAGNPPVPLFFLQNRTVTFSQSGVAVTSVTVPAGGSATVDVTITPNPAADEDRTLYGGWLTFTAGNQTFRVPYAGFVGDYQSLQVLQAGAAGIFPTIGRLTGFVSATDRTLVHTPVAAGATFTMTGGDVPYVLAHFAHQARAVRVELFDAGTNRRVGEVLRDEYRERNSRRTGTTNDTNSDVYLPFAIDGSVKKGNGREVVPDGQYYVVFSVTKALADDATPTEQWTSASFLIDRP